MAFAIADCKVLSALGMGAGAYESLCTAKIRPVVTVVADINDVVLQFVRARW